MFNERELGDGIIMENVEKIDIIGKPADAEEDDDTDEHLDYLLLVLLCPCQGIRIITHHLCLPEGGAHPGVADQHHQPWQQVCHQEEYNVVAEKGIKKYN